MQMTRERERHEVDGKAELSEGQAVLFSAEMLRRSDRARKVDSTADESSEAQRT